MAESLKDLIAAANDRVATIDPGDALNRQGNGALILDIREPGELQQNGSVADALHVPRGLLEWKADPGGDAADVALTAKAGSGEVLVLCAAGGRAALAADTLSRMGYDALVIKGGLNGWKSAGLPVAG
ncbi:rhodanese-like domain-containing protein [Jannaschia sp. KMU-145]|uniref:rhodanese-like domain-containing protein n=1 Tax=Jannaschia halovivens TaxID=3388667 RepID=UPI00396B1976